MLKHSGVWLHGLLENIYACGQVFFRYTAIKSKDIMLAWLHHLALNTLEDYEQSRETILISKDQNKIIFRSLEQQKAQALLLDLFQLYWGGLRQPLCFFPETSRVYATAYLSGKSHSQALSKAQKKWGENKWSEQNDVYIQKVFGLEALQDSPWKENFTKTALAVFKPIVQSSNL